MKNHALMCISSYLGEILNMAPTFTTNLHTHNIITLVEYEGGAFFYTMRYNSWNYRLSSLLGKLHTDTPLN